MEVGNEISQKIRSAIKAKLIELGAYVDDELPDYIMVMVANKKNHQQMKDDLSLFLSHNTENFTAWLQSLLKKLQSINTEPSSSKHKPKEKHKGEKRKHKSGQSDKASKSDVPEKKKKSSVSTEDSAAVSSAAGDTVREEKKEVTSAPSSTGKAPAAAPAAVEVESTEINISENTDEFNEENKEIEKKPDSSKSSSTGKPPTAKATKSKKSSGEAAHSSKSSSKRKSGEASTADKHAQGETRKKPSSFVVAVKRKYEDLGEPEEEYDPTNPAVGSVASIVRGPTRKSSVPKSLQANKSLLMKAVSDAEKSVTTTKKTDLPEKQGSEPGMHSDRKPVDLSRRLKTAAGLQLISRSKRKEFEKMKYTVSNQGTAKETSGVKRSRSSSVGKEKMQFTVKNDSATSPSKASTRVQAPLAGSSRMAASAIKDISKQSAKVTAKVRKAASPDGNSSDQEEDDGQYGPPLPDMRLVQHSKPADEEPGYEDSPQPSRSETESPADHVTDPEIQRILDESHELTEETGYLFEEELEDTKRVIKSKPSPEPVDPKFIVTLDGVDPLTYAALPEVRENVDAIIQSIKPQVRVDEVIKAERPMVAVEPEQAYSAKLHPPKIKPFNINLKDTDDEEEGEEAGESTEATPKTIQERCRFWPVCANGNACQYIHPSIPCKTFPYCKFGERCLYIHPNCKFDASCTRYDCPYTHASKRAPHAAPTVIHKVVQVPMQQYVPAYIPGPQQQQGVKQSSGNMCRFFPNCNNMNCPFVHPKPCRYGIACMNKANCMFSHPSLPEKDKMKWSANAKKEETKKPELAVKATGPPKKTT